MIHEPPFLSCKSSRHFSLFEKIWFVLFYVSMFSHGDAIVSGKTFAWEHRNGCSSYVSTSACRNQILRSQKHPGAFSLPVLIHVSYNGAYIEVRYLDGIVYILTRKSQPLVLCYKVGFKLAGNDQIYIRFFTAW